MSIFCLNVERKHHTQCFIVVFLFKQIIIHRLFQVETFIFVLMICISVHEQCWKYLTSLNSCQICCLVIPGQCCQGIMILCKPPYSIVISEMCFKGNNYCMQNSLLSLLFVFSALATVNFPGETVHNYLRRRTRRHNLPAGGDSAAHHLKGKLLQPGTQTSDCPVLTNQPPVCS